MTARIVRPVHPEMDRNHCCECTSPEIRYGSLYPLEPIYDQGDGKVNNPSNTNAANIPSMKFNIDYNVCSKCYVKQFRLRYPQEVVPIKLGHLRKLENLNKQFQVDQELEHAQAVIARRERQEEKVA